MGKYRVFHIYSAKVNKNLSLISLCTENFLVIFWDHVWGHLMFLVFFLFLLTNISSRAVVGKLLKIFKISSKWSKTVQNCQKLSKKTQNCQKWPKIIKHYHAGSFCFIFDPFWSTLVFFWSILVPFWSFWAIFDICNLAKIRDQQSKHDLDHQMSA